MQMAFPVAGATSLGPAAWQPTPFTAELLSYWSHEANCQALHACVACWQAESLILHKTCGGQCAGASVSMDKVWHGWHA